MKNMQRWLRGMIDAIKRFYRADPTYVRNLGIIAVIIGMCLAAAMLLSINPTLVVLVGFIIGNMFWISQSSYRGE